MPTYQLMEGMMPPSTYWMDYADYNHHYADWLERLDDLCQRFLDLRLADLVEHGTVELDPSDAYLCHCRPEAFLHDAVIPYMQSEYGAEFIDEQIAINILMGTPPSPRIDP